MISRTEAESVATSVSAPEFGPLSESEKAKLENNPWRVRGLMRYEEEDLAYADRKVVEAAQMDSIGEQRWHLQEVIDFFAAKYFVEFTVEGLLRDSNFDLVYLHKMLAEAADDLRPGLDYEEVMAEIFGEYIDDDEI